MFWVIIEVKMFAWFVPPWWHLNISVDTEPQEHLELKECFHKCTKCDCNVSLYVCSWWSRWSCHVPPVVGHTGTQHAVKQDRENQEHPSPLQFHQLSEPLNKDAGEMQGKERRGEKRWAKRTRASFPLMPVAAWMETSCGAFRDTEPDWLHSPFHVWCFCRFDNVLKAEIRNWAKRFKAYVNYTTHQSRRSGIIRLARGRMETARDDPADRFISPT